MADPSVAAIPAFSEDLAALETHLVATRGAARPFLWLAPRLGWLPRVGEELVAAPVLLDMAVEVAAGGRQAVDALKPVTDALAVSAGMDTLPQIVSGLASAAPALAGSDARLAAAAAAACPRARPATPPAGESAGPGGPTAAAGPDRPASRPGGARAARPGRPARVSHPRTEQPRAAAHRRLYQRGGLRPAGRAAKSPSSNSATVIPWTTGSSPTRLRRGRSASRWAPNSSPSATATGRPISPKQPMWHAPSMPRIRVWQPTA